MGIALRENGTKHSLHYPDKQNKLCPYWRLFPRASPTKTRREGTIGQLVTGLRPCHVGRRTCWPQGVAVAGPRIHRPARERRHRRKRGRRDGVSGRPSQAHPARWSTAEPAEPCEPISLRSKSACAGACARVHACSYQKGSARFGTMVHLLISQLVSVPNLVHTRGSA